MPRYLCKLDDQYFEWSTIVDAPTTFGMTREEMEEYHREEYGVSADAELARRLARVDATGCSARDGTTVDDLIASNRAGPNESALTREELLRYLKTGARDE